MPALMRRLQGLVALSEGDLDALLKATGKRRAYAPAQEIVHEHDMPDGMAVMMSGMAGRYRSLENGGRQYVGYLLPGDLLDFGSLGGGRADCGVKTFGPVSIARIAAEDLLPLMTGHPAIARALWKAVVQDLSISREWTLNVGQRNAEQRITHLLCEQYFRLTAIGAARDGVFTLPVTQRDIADSAGLTVVHVNRVLQRLRRADLFTFDRGVCEIRDLAGLMRLAGFDPFYLRLPPALIPADALR